MNSIPISLIVFACLFAGALLGLFLRTLLPEHHLNEKSKDALKIGLGLIATLTALVLGLLVSSAKNSFDSVNEELKQASTKVIILDHVLAHYGPETDKIRDLLRHNISSVVALIWDDGKGKQDGLKTLENVSQFEETRYKIQELRPQNDSQRAYQAEALQISKELSQSRWLFIEQAQSPLPTPFLVVLVFWLGIFFMGFGLLAPKNPTLIAIMFVCSLSLSGAIFLILEMNRPLEGTFKVSSAPLRKAISILNQKNEPNVNLQKKSI